MTAFEPLNDRLGEGFKNFVSPIHKVRGLEAAPVYEFRFTVRYNSVTERTPGSHMDLLAPAILVWIIVLPTVSTKSLKKAPKSREETDQHSRTASSRAYDPERLTAMAESEATSPLEPSTPGSFPTANGTNGNMSEQSPTPPPHRVLTSPIPPPKPAVDAEACKAAGNKFFKAKDYERAITEYTKGSILMHAQGSATLFCYA